MKVTQLALSNTVPLPENNIGEQHLNFSFRMATDVIAQ